VAAVFSRRANARFAIALTVLGLVAVGIVVTPMIVMRTPYASDQFAAVVQPVAFDHRHHVRDDVIDCVYCHTGVETTANAGIPPTEVCMGCHSQVWPDSPRLAPVRQSWMTGKAIDWKRVYDLPDHVYFHHGVHISAGIDCSRCHGDVAAMPRVYRETPLTMKWCLDCHRSPRNGIDPGRAITRITTCSACHR
jgi:hypothetical protein